MAPIAIATKRQALASVTWWCEVWTLILTGLYCAVVATDIVAGRAHLTSAAWFDQGFCVWQGPAKINSHELCFVADLAIGGALAGANWFMYKKHGLSNLIIATAISIFSVLHGFGHLSIDILGPDLQKDTGPSLSSPFSFAAAFVSAALFLAIAPFIGYSFGVNLKLCILIHLISSFAFLHVPQQFAFGAVQLIINCWYCLPRVLWFSCKEEEAVSKRVDAGWAAASIGNLFLMPVVFSEMLACEAFYKSLTGHFLYDASTLALTAVYSATLWSSVVKEGKKN